MTINVGSFDRIIRALIGVGLLYLAFLSGYSLFEQAFLKYGAAIVGLVMLMTSLLKLCPIYSIFGIKTCKEC